MERITIAGKKIQQLLFDGAYVWSVYYKSGILSLQISNLKKSVK